MERKTYSRKKLLGLGAGISAVLLNDVSAKYIENKKQLIFGNETGKIAPNISFPSVPEVKVGPQQHNLIIPEVSFDGNYPPKPEYRLETKYIAKKPNWTKEFLQSNSDLVNSIKTSKPLIAVCIDDGFMPEDRLALFLKIAIDKKITFTDFMKGLQREKSPNYIKQEIESERVEFGTHTQVHRDERNSNIPGVPPTRDLLTEDIIAPERYLNQFGQTCFPYHRPPGGESSPWTREVAASIGFRNIRWSANADYGNTTPVASLRPGDIILLHYTEPTLSQFAGWIDAVRSKGLEPTALSNVFAAEGK